METNKQNLGSPLQKERSQTRVRPGSGKRPAAVDGKFLINLFEFFCEESIDTNVEKKSYF